MFCTKCGASMSPGQKFCTKCGAKIDENKQKQEPNKTNSKKGGFLKSILYLILLALLALTLYCTYRIVINNESPESVIKNIFNIKTKNESSSIDVIKPGEMTNSNKQLPFKEQVRNARLLTSYGATATIDDMETVKFGKYEQDGLTSNGAEEIEWIVIDRNNQAAFLLSKYALDCAQYYDMNNYTSWENSYVRSWLNSSFYNSAFDSSEKNKIINMPISNQRNPVYPEAEGGSPTNDNVFLLSGDEAMLYFGEVGYNLTNYKIATSATNYAKSKGAYSHGISGFGGGNTIYWLRGPGSTKSNAIDVSPLGYVNFGGNMVVIPQAVRPAIWVDLTK